MVAPGFFPTIVLLIREIPSDNISTVVVGRGVWKSLNKVLDFLWFQAYLACPRNWGYVCEPTRLECWRFLAGQLQPLLFMSGVPSWLIAQEVV
jgi:hypothetical protein